VSRMAFYITARTAEKKELLNASLTWSTFRRMVMMRLGCVTGPAWLDVRQSQSRKEANCSAKSTQVELVCEALTDFPPASFSTEMTVGN